MVRLAGQGGGQLAADMGTYQGNEPAPAGALRHRREHDHQLNDQRNGGGGDADTPMQTLQAPPDKAGRGDRHSMASRRHRTWALVSSG
jgi:hypothetical protein